MRNSLLGLACLISIGCSTAVQKERHLQTRSLSQSHPKIPKGYILPDNTLSPDHRYGVLMPIFDPNNSQSWKYVKNSVIEVGTGRVVTEIAADVEFDRRLLPSRWSADSTVLCWEINGKWGHDAL
jgi:hypothetical protein